MRELFHVCSTVHQTTISTRARHHFVYLSPLLNFFEQSWEMFRKRKKILIYYLFIDQYNWVFLEMRASRREEQRLSPFPPRFHSLFLYLLLTYHRTLAHPSSPPHLLHIQNEQPLSNGSPLVKWTFTRKWTKQDSHHLPRYCAAACNLAPSK